MTGCSAAPVPVPSWLIVLMLAFMVADIVIAFAKNGEFKKPEKYNAGASLLSGLIMVAMFYAAGFFDPLLKR